jgi:transcriptional regulator with XRE-family HTH domain
MNTIRCPWCQLVQYEGLKCRRCKKPFAEPVEAEVAKAPCQGAQIVPASRDSSDGRHKSNAELIGSRLVAIRKWRHLTQPKLAELMGCPRTYISKIENGHALPMPAQIFRLAEVLKVDAAALVVSDREVAVKELLSDSFVAEFRGLNEEQRKQVLFYARNLGEKI